MTIFEIILGSTLLSAAVTSGITLLVNRKKRKAQTNYQEIQNVKATIEIYQTAAKDLKKEVDALRCQVADLNYQIDALRSENRELKQLIADLKESKP